MVVTGMKIIRRERQFIWVDLPTHRSLSSLSEIDKEADSRLTELETGWTNMKMISTDWQHLVCSPPGDGDKLLSSID